MTAAEMKRVLELHKKWLDNEEGGSGANLSWANLSGANGKKCKIKNFLYLGPIYKYYCWAVEFKDGSRWIRMGCLFKPLDEWEKIGIAKSNLGEFQEDGSKASRRRVMAYEFVKSSMAVEFE